MDQEIDLIVIPVVALKKGSSTSQKKSTMYNSRLRFTMLSLESNLLVTCNDSFRYILELMFLLIRFSVLHGSIHVLQYGASESCTPQKCNRPESRIET